MLGNRWQFTSIVIVALTLLLTAPAATALEAGHLNASDEWLVEECGEMWPNQGAFETYVNDGAYEVGYYFTFSEEELAALECVASRIEFRFVIGGFENAINAQRTSEFTSDLGGKKRSATYDVDNDVTLRYGYINTEDLEAGENDIHLAFQGLETDESDNPWVAVQISMVREDGETVHLFLSRGKLNDVIYFNDGDEFGYQWIPFGN